ncbi:MAG TPA: hypothetical protein VNI55_01560 [Gaiellaceae bacterium]|nr:hypothetical protein [Gaiellaceae bacterium]
MLRLRGDLLGEGEDARHRVGDRPGRAVGLLDRVVHRLHARDPDELAGDEVAAVAADERAEAEPFVRGRAPAADPGVHDHEPGDAVGVLDREPQPDRAAPVLYDDGQVSEVELLDEPDDRAAVEVEGVVLDPGRLVGASEAEVVRHDCPSRRSQLRDHLAIEVRPRRLSVEEQHRRAGALVEVVEPEPLLLDVVRLERVAGEIREVLVGGSVGLHAHPSERTNETKKPATVENAT